MTRPIKFRAWEKSKLRMLFRGLFDRNWYLTPNNDEEGCHTVQSIAPTDQTSMEVMQFTGLHDKNGKEIWEGDVVVNNEQPWEVYYGDGAWRLVLRGEVKRPNDHLMLLEDKHCEVTGNIYEN